MSQRISKEELDEQFEQFLKESLSDDSFGSSKKSVLENLGKPNVKPTKKKVASPWWITEDDSDDGELARTSRSFLKSQNTSQPIEEVEEEYVEEMQKSIDPLVASIEKDSLEIDESVVASGPNQAFHGVGLDTLEEQEEKERFFAILEKGASSTIDYSKLNKELDSTDSTPLTAYIRHNDRVQGEEDEDKGESKDVSVNYSEDFEDEPEANSDLVRKSEESNDLMESKTQTPPEDENHGMLAKVILIDSVDSTIDIQKTLQQTQDGTEPVMAQGTNEAMGTGFSNPYTNSDIEALHQAYQNLNSSIKDADDQSSDHKVTNTMTSCEPANDSKENSLNKVLAGNSDISTVDDLMQRIRGDEHFSVSSINMHMDNGVLPYTSHKPIVKGSVQEQEVSQDLHNWNGEKTQSSGVFPASEFGLHYTSKKNITDKVQENHGQPTTSKEPSLSEMLKTYSGKRSDHADRCGTYPGLSTPSSELIHSKHPNKIMKSPPSPLKKSHNTHYSYVKSSGYGKVSLKVKETSNDDSLKPKELPADVKWKSPTDRKQKGALSATKSIRFAENACNFPKDKMERQETAAQINIGKAKDYEKRLQNVEEKLNAGHGQKVTFKEDSLINDFKQEMEQMKINYEKEIKALKQENFILQTKLNAGEEKVKKRSRLFGDQKNPIMEEEIQQIRQEILEQETLLHGYQQENERLYNQVKDLQVKNKQNEGQMFQENQALKVELISIREEMNSAKLHNQYTRSESDHNAKSYTDLAAELRAIQVENLRHDHGNQSVQQQNRLKDRATDAKRIQDLERQVKEMEAVIKRRHPNSIPALMFAAAAVSETEKPSKTSTTGYLERRIQKLENDLESKDEEAKKSLRSMEQHFQKVKIQYECRINDLEELLAKRCLNEPQKNIDNTVKVKALEQELSIVKDAHHATVMSLQKEIGTLKEKNFFLDHKVALEEGNIKSNTTVEEIRDHTRLALLNQELVSKTKEIQELSKTVERLQKERMMMLSVKHHSSTARKGNKHSDMTTGGLPSLSGSTIEKEHFPAMLDDKLYKPDTFTDLRISDLQQENRRLESELLKLTEDMNQQITHYKTSLVNAEYAVERLKEEAAKELAVVKQSHQREVEKLICKQALEHSSSRVAELTSNISTQEILIKHLQKQVAGLQKDREALTVSRIREETLQKEMAKLLDELKIAKDCHSPEMKHFLTLQSKVKHMEIRHSQREQELQQIIDQTCHVADATQVKEIEKWKKLVQQKNTQLEKFRTELDAILDVLRMLQQQGVVIPASASEIYYKV
ncbi:hypothetical protein GDO78_001514 [Eleutherodactylus coqui]|uniref:Centrosomal protein of 162 kDa n=1 Tax=Eleutherodactylus coqui TaxID=57060 RepID=A0A8J6KNN7_ELECQ|nr:hypothetical protein GDO78_001514 [Eleutherodactylus coqui]